MTTQIRCDRCIRHFVAANCAGDVNVRYYQISSSDAVAFPGIEEGPVDLNIFGIEGFASGGFELVGTFCFSSSGNVWSHG